MSGVSTLTEDVSSPLCVGSRIRSFPNLSDRQSVPHPPSTRALARPFSHPSVCMRVRLLVIHLFHLLSNQTLEISESRWSEVLALDCDPG